MISTALPKAKKAFRGKRELVLLEHHKSLWQRWQPQRAHGPGQRDLELLALHQAHAGHRLSAADLRGPQKSRPPRRQPPAHPARFARAAARPRRPGWAAR